MPGRLAGTLLIYSRGVTALYVTLGPSTSDIFVTKNFVVLYLFLIFFLDTTMDPCVGPSERVLGRTRLKFGCPAGFHEHF